MKHLELAGLLLTVIGTLCWGVCFWWMHRISVRQDSMLCELHDVIRRIETLSEREHELIQEVHPVVEKIRESVQDVAVAVAAEDSAGNAIKR